MAGVREWACPEPAVQYGRRAEGVLRQRILWRRHRDRRRGEEYHQPVIARQAGQTDPVLPLGEPRTGRDERVVVDRRVRDRRHGPCWRLHLLRESELRDRWVALSRSRSL